MRTHYVSNTTTESVWRLRAPRDRTIDGSQKRMIFGKLEPKLEGRRTSPW